MGEGSERTVLDKGSGEATEKKGRVGFSVRVCITYDTILTCVGIRTRVITERSKIEEERERTDNHRRRDDALSFSLSLSLPLVSFASLYAPLMRTDDGG